MTLSFLFFDVNKLKKKSGRSSSRVANRAIEEVKKFNPDISGKLFPFTSLRGQPNHYGAICELTGGGGAQFCIFHQELEEYTAYEELDLLDALLNWYF
jgi:hypothetical protein